MALTEQRNLRMKSGRAEGESKNWVWINKIITRRKEDAFNHSCLRISWFSLNGQWLLRLKSALSYFSMCTHTHSADVHMHI